MTVRVDAAIEAIQAVIPKTRLVLEQNAAMTLEDAIRVLERLRSKENGDAQ